MTDNQCLDKCWKHVHLDLIHSCFTVHMYSMILTTDSRYHVLFVPTNQCFRRHIRITFSLGMKFFRLNNSCYSLVNIENPTTLPIKCTGLSTPCWHEFTCYENTLERQCIVPESSPHWLHHHQPAYLLFQYHILSYVYIKIEIDYEKFGALNKFSSIQLCSPNLTRSTQ